MNMYAIQLIPIIIACGIGCVVGYYVFQILDFLVGITIFVFVALLVLYQFLEPTSTLHQAFPGVPVLFEKMPEAPTTMPKP